MVSKDAILSGFQYFNLKGLKGRPTISNQQEYDQMLEMWSEALQDVDEKTFILACKMLSDELTFYPAFAEVRKKCDDLMNGKQDIGLEVWNKYSKQMMAAHGQYANPEDKERLFNNINCEVIKQACRLFDWRAYGQSNENQEMFHMREFEKLYNSLSEKYKFKKSAERSAIGMNNQVKGLIDNLTKEIE